MAPTCPPVNNPEHFAAATSDFTLRSSTTNIILPLLILWTVTVTLWCWRFPCMTIERLDTIVEDIRSLIHVDTPHHVDVDLLNFLPDMDAVRVEFQSLLSELSILKEDGYRCEPKHIHLWRWLSFHRRQLFKIDALYWGFRDVKMRILAAIEKERRQK